MSASAAAVEGKRLMPRDLLSAAQQALEGGKLRFIPAYDEFGKQFIFSIWFTTTDYATKHADIVKTFARSSQTPRATQLASQGNGADALGIQRRSAAMIERSARHQRHRRVRQRNPAVDRHRGEVRLISVRFRQPRSSIRHHQK